MPTELDPDGAESTALLEAAQFNEARVLEVGSGDGRLAFRYAVVSASVVGIEPDATQLALARRACPASLRRRVSFVQATALALPFRSATFDIAVLAWSLWWLPHEGMVHALRGLWRVLAEHGTLVDVRPLSSQCPLEAVSAEALVQIGEVDGTGMMADDAAADDAIRQSVDHGWFVSRRKATLDFAFYWDSVAEMASVLDGRRRTKQVVPSYADLERAHQDLSARHGAGVRLRCRTPTLLAVYEKAIRRWARAGIGAVNSLILLVSATVFPWAFLLNALPAEDSGSSATQGGQPHMHGRRAVLSIISNSTFRIPR